PGGPGGRAVIRDIEAERAEIDGAVAGRTVCGMFADRAARDPEGEALRWQEAGAWRSLTWAEYRERVRDLTLGLRGLGFGRGQFGIIAARNVPEHLVADLAIVHAGGAAISAYNTLAPEQLEYLVNHSGARVAVVEDEGFLGKFLAIRERVPTL